MENSIPSLVTFGQLYDLIKRPIFQNFLFEVIAIFRTKN